MSKGLLFSLILKISIWFVLSLSPKVFFRVTTLKCEHDPELYNGSTNCFIKPFRNGTRLLTIEYNFRKPCNDFWIHMILYYKFGGSAHYRPWMFNNDEDACGYYRGTSRPGIWFALLKKAIEEITPRTLHACPYHGIEGITSVDVEKIVATSLPQIIPTGDYRIYIRFHTKTNKTYLQVTIGGHIDALNPLDAVKMG